MLTTDQLTALLSQPMNRMQQGRIAALLQIENRKPTPGNKQQRQLLADLLNAEVPAAEVYNHPEAGHLPPRDPGPLSPVEVAWLQRLPADPAAVTFDDAQALASLARNVKPMAHPADARLVDSIWAPVKAVHDRNAAQARLRTAQQPSALIPSTALGALAEAVQANHTDLYPDEALSRASTLLQQTASARSTTHQRAVDAAHAELAALDEARTRRNATVVA